MIISAIGPIMHRYKTGQAVRGVAKALVCINSINVVSYRNVTDQTHLTSLGITGDRALPNRSNWPEGS